MKLQRWMAVVLVTVVTGLTALVVDGWWFAMVLGVLGLIGTRRRLTWELPLIRRLIAILFLALIFAVYYRTQLRFSMAQDLNWIALTAWQELTDRLVLTRVPVS